MTPAELLNSAIRPALLKLPFKMRSKEAEAMILGISLQESGCKFRKQINGPARGYAQFELIGVQGVMSHPSTGLQAELLCDALGVPANPDEVFEAIAWHDVLAMGFARLLLWQSPAAIPIEASGPDAGWLMYVQQWRPGRPRPEKWDANWRQAWGLVG